MKRNLGLLLAFLLYCSYSLAIPLNKPIEAPQKVALSYFNDNWVMGLEDNSYWKLKPLPTKPAQSYYEWWYGITPPEWQLDAEFFFDPKSWQSVAEIQVYENELKDILPEYTHILQNTANGQMALAAYMPSGAALVPKMSQIYKFLNSSQQTSHQLAKNLHFLDNILLLKDDSLWKICLQYRYQQPSWSEWWYSTPIDQPDKNFVFDLSTWNVDDEIVLYSPLAETSDVNTTYATQKQPSEVFLLENVTQNKFTYVTHATATQVVEAYAAFSEKQWHNGYHSGHSTGYNAGYSAGYSAGLR